MALTISLIATFIIPGIIITIILYWRRSLRRKIEQQDKEKGELIGIMEEIIDTKDSIIDKLKV
jgi:hypothetical protein